MSITTINELDEKLFLKLNHKDIRNVRLVDKRIFKLINWSFWKKKYNQDFSFSEHRDYRFAYKKREQISRHISIINSLMKVQGLNRQNNIRVYFLYNLENSPGDYSYSRPLQIDSTNLVMLKKYFETRYYFESGSAETILKAIKLFVAKLLPQKSFDIHRLKNNPNLRGLEYDTLS